MPDFSDSLKSFFLDLVDAEAEINEESLLSERISGLEKILPDSEAGTEESEILLKSALDATCLSILSGNIGRNPTDYELGIEDITNIGQEDERNEGLNSIKYGKSRDWLFENRVRAWYGNHLDSIFPDLTQKHDESVCEFAIQEESFENQIIECKRFNGSLVEMIDEKLERKFERHYEKVIEKQFPSTESLENLENAKRHLLLEITDYSSETRIIEGNGTEYEVEGCRDEEIGRVKDIILEKHEDFEIDQITLVWTILYKDEEKVKGIAERTEKIISSEEIIDYQGWNFFGHKDFTGNQSFGKLLCHHEAKSDEWMIAALDADNQVFFTQKPAEPT